MYVMLSKNAFTRSYGEHGFIINQLTNFDRLYNHSGSVFLQQISRTPRHIEDITETLHTLFTGVDKTTLAKDFVEFVTELAVDGYVLLGEDKATLASQDVSFSYNPKNTNTPNSAFRDITEFSLPARKLSWEGPNTTHRLNHIFLELTRKCNERCVHCYIPALHKDRGVDMPFEDAKRYISQASEMGVLAVTLTGGEPFLHPAISDILYYARERDLLLFIFSNLTVVTTEQIHTLKDVNVAQIQVSLYSMDPAVHDLITTIPGSWTKTFTTINRMFEEDIPLQISCPATKYNYRHFQDVLKWSSEHGIKARTDISLNAQYDGNRGNLSNAPNGEMIAELLQGMLESDQDWKRDIASNYAKGIHLERAADENVCGAGVELLYIASTGRALPCSSWESLAAGDLKQHPLDEIWRESPQLKLLRDLKVRDYPDYVNSEFREFMTVCPMRFANYNNGDYRSIPEPIIAHARLTKQIVDNYVKEQRRTHS